MDIVFLGRRAKGTSPGPPPDRKMNYANVSESQSFIVNVSRRNTSKSEMIYSGFFSPSLSFGGRSVSLLRSVAERAFFTAHILYIIDFQFCVLPHFPDSVRNGSLANEFSSESCIPYTYKHKISYWTIIK
ncbi:hypothetical protein GWI33_016643 [Rhynchophorus ferrugineus]|uniref:Uncharacterized protein n=1 Tax=Rhynchophorus ferrugineus TaxID=354439 RepID=A0A834M8G0_RHYFE|nr:hypothetical protein GWI33_016643 [Rhynchophorus ferrugineus]